MLQVHRLFLLGKHKDFELYSWWGEKITFREIELRRDEGSLTV